MSTATAAKRTPLEDRMYDEGKADATAGRPSTPPTMGGKAEAAYLAGYTDATPTKKATAKKATAKKATAGRSSSTRPRRASPARGIGARSTRAATRAVTRPVERQLTSGLTALGTAVALAVLLNALRNATYASRTLDGVAKFVHWLDTPRPIPYRK